MRSVARIVALGVLAPALAAQQFAPRRASVIDCCRSTGCFEYARITDTNRNHPTMMGGWGPHLRAVMTAQDGSLWYADDQATSVLQNDRVRYFKLENGIWQLAGTNDFYPAFGNIQQNTAHVMRYQFVLSYGVDTLNRWLMECYFDTTDPTYKACNTIYVSGAPLALTPNTNYVGAAVNSAGTKLVWWTEVRTGASAPGYWNYIYDSGSGWNGPVQTPVAVGGTNYDFLGYVHLVFIGPDSAAFVGETLRGSTFSALSGSFQLGMPAVLELHPGTINGDDIWYDDVTGDLHALLYGPGAVHYEYKPSGGSWSSVQALVSTYRARFIYDEDGETLHLVTGASSSTMEGPKVRSVRRSAISGPLDWLGRTPRQVPIPYDGFGFPNAIYSQSMSYQTQRVTGLRFGLVGQSPPSAPARDDETWFYEFKPCLCEAPTLYSR